MEQNSVTSWTERELWNFLSFPSNVQFAKVLCQCQKLATRIPNKNCWSKQDWANICHRKKDHVLETRPTTRNLKYSPCCKLYRELWLLYKRIGSAALCNRQKIVPIQKEGSYLDLETKWSTPNVPTSAWAAPPRTTSPRRVRTTPSRAAALDRVRDQDRDLGAVKHRVLTSGSTTTWWRTIASNSMGCISPKCFSRSHWNVPLGMWWSLRSGEAGVW